MTDYAAIADLLEMVLTYPKQCAADGIETVARRRQMDENTVELADNLAHWKRKHRDTEAA